MDEVTYYELEYWGWECPRCNYYYETQDDPGYDEYLLCEECNERFKPVQG